MELPVSPPNFRRYRGVAWVTLLCLFVVTSVPPGATRVFSWPWSILYAAALLGAPCILGMRAFSPDRSLFLPSRGWLSVAVGAAGAIIVSALLSPHRAPSLLWSAPLLSAIAVFLALFDALQGADSPETARFRLWRMYVVFFALVGCVSLAEWLNDLRHVNLSRLVAGRNPYPLGHSNYTAGLALLLLPACGAVALRQTAAVRTRLAAVAGVALGLGLLLSSGSRGGMIALGAVALAALIAAPLRRGRKWQLGAIAIVVGLAFVAANPRTRAMLRRSEAEAPPNISNVQRHAMVTAGELMGADRPIFGWGPGTTPLVFPRYRAHLDGGAEDVLQLHCLPVQLWAELGAAGLLAAAGFLILAWRGRRTDPAAALTLAGYAVFSLFDAQFDVPVFGFGVATLAALLAAPAPVKHRNSRLVGLATLVTLGLIVAFGRPAATASVNAAALSAAHRGDRNAAVHGLEASLALNPDQELAHFNLGWLLVVDEPRRAAQHFTAAAHLVPDKGGVYFGLGLARLNTGDEAGAARAFALEALNDPVFLISPWWQNERLAPLRAQTWEDLATYRQQLDPDLPADGWSGRELRYVAALARWIEGRDSSTAVIATANTEARRLFFSQRPAPSVLNRIGTEKLERERTGYPVLMRNLDIAPPRDLWVVHQSQARDSDLAFLWPDKGWLPSPLLIALLDGRQSPKK
jgi:O-antigen ligase